MAQTALQPLNYFSALYNTDLALQELVSMLSSNLDSNSATDETLAQYQQAIRLIEKALWSGEEILSENNLKHYQQLYRELEALISEKGGDHRARFIITIPVADRPQHLQSCLDSLLTLCRTFQYGGMTNGKYSRVMAIIADDSKEKSNISKNREIATHFNSAALETLYFGQDEQLQQLDKLSDAQSTSLQHAIGAIDRSAFYHKGASIMRNISYLKLRELTQNGQPALLYFIDSDQEFRVKVDTPKGERDLYALSFLHDLEQIFSQTPVEILTGKVVGDPPVSPSVMAGNFLEDVISFLQRISELTPEQACQFHSRQHQRIDDASYHDMADLFGFKASTESFQYKCPLTREHDHLACFGDFADKLNRFFDGEHPTRKSYYEHQDLNNSITPARTIYSGNYIFRSSTLDYFIPFATLKLRMAGPVLGRIIKAELGNKFVSANLPMLHKRTVHETGQSEFRPGVDRNNRQIDLSGEFERQFFGDVMLFTMEKLTAAGYPKQEISVVDIRKQVESTEADMQQKYQTKQQQIIEKITMFRSIFSDPQKWWNMPPYSSSEHVVSSKQKFKSFILNIEHNFGLDAAAYRLIGSKTNREQRLSAIVDAISQYRQDRSNWNNIITL